MLSCTCDSDAAGERSAVKRQCQSSSVSGNVADADKTTNTADDDDQVMHVNNDEEDEEKIPDWIRCSPADLFFKRDSVSIDLVGNNQLAQSCAKPVRIHRGLC